MGTDISLWRVEGDSLSRVMSQGIPLESQLEDLIEKDPSVLGERVLVIGRQVHTDLDGRIDLLGIGDDGTVHVIELKRGRTPRESVAQLLGYGAWVKRLSHHDIVDLYQRENPGSTFDTAFFSTFGTNAPAELNSEHRLTLVAHSSSAAVEHSVEYLAAHGVPINILLFSFFTDGEHRFLARTTVVDDVSSTAQARSRPGSTGEPWNKRDWYVSFGENQGSRNWDDARRFGFVSAGAGAWHSRTLTNLPVGARIFVHLPKTGYVGVGEVTGEAVPYTEAALEMDGERRRFTDLDLVGTYTHEGEQEDEELLEHVVPVRWLHARGRDRAVWRSGFFANQNSACRFRNSETLDRLRETFELED